MFCVAARLCTKLYVKHTGRYETHQIRLEASSLIVCCFQKGHLVARGAETLAGASCFSKPPYRGRRSHKVFLGQTPVSGQSPQYVH